MGEPILFSSPEAFEQWLLQHGTIEKEIWLKLVLPEPSRMANGTRPMQGLLQWKFQKIWPQPSNAVNMLLYVLNR